MRFYGDHSSSWVSAKQLLPWEGGAKQRLQVDALTHWGKKNSRCV